MDVDNISPVIEREDITQSKAQHKHNLSGFVSLLVHNIELSQEKSFRFELKLGVQIKLPAIIKFLEFINPIKHIK